jgi:hypothetical protein
MSVTSADIAPHNTKESPEPPHADPAPVRIITYQDLLNEEERLTLELKHNKARVMEDFNIFKKKLQPADQALNFMNKLSGGTGKPGLLSTGVDIALDLLSKKYLFRRSGWLVTLAGSYLVRGMSQLFLQKAGSNKNQAHTIKTNGQVHTIAEEIPNQ